MTKGALLTLSSQLGKKKQNSLRLARDCYRSVQICRHVVVISLLINVLLRLGRVKPFLDEGGIQGAGVLHTACSSLKKLFNQGGLFLLQLGDPLAPLCHLLNENK